MNYPIWDVSFGAGLLIAIVAITHVFVSHFAVGGGLFLVLTEKRAYRLNDQPLLEWLTRHTKFFVLLTVVYGAISGVGIWFTIGLIHPSGTSSLIHTYVWGWAIEWVFFFVEITAALLYLYGWKKLNRKTHLWLGWIYFIAAFLSMVIINGIITFMLTSGKWTQSYNFWQGFFNPTYFPSLFLRFAFSLALAGIYALLTGSVQKDQELKGRIVKWSAKWIVPAFVLLPVFAFWYIGSIPAEVWDSAQGKMPTASRYANLILIFSAVTFVLSLLTLLKPKRVRLLFSILIFASAFVSMWSFEFIREAIRKPYLINNYLYVNSIFKEPVPGSAGMSLAEINQNGLLKTAKWSKYKEVTPENQLEAGREIFHLQCQSCHTLDGYRSMRKIIQKRNWSYSALRTNLGSLDKMFNGVMPPFAGTEEEKEALANFLISLPPGHVPGAPPPGLGGEAVYEQYCAPCHQRAADDPLFAKLGKLDEQTIYYLISKLDSLNPEIPPFEGTDQERQALAEWIEDAFE